MTSYPGPWIQAPDYDVTGEWSDADPALPVSNVSYKHEWSTGPDAATTKATMMNNILTDLKTVLNASPPSMTEAEAAAYVESFGFVSGGEDYVDYRQGIGSVYTDGIDSGGPYGAFSVEHNAVAQARFLPQAVSPFHFSVNAWAPSILFPPPGAIGWEWADETPSDMAKPSEVLGAVGTIYPAKNAFGWTDGSTDPPVATLGTQLLPCPEVTYASDAGWVPDSSFADAVVDWSGPFAGGVPTIDQAIDVPNVDPTFRAWTTPVAGDFDAVDYSVPHSEAGTVEHHDPLTFDLSPYLDHLGRATFSARVYTAAEVFIPGQAAYGYQPAGLGVIWTFRPPIFRWLYATPQITSAPPLRHTQRDDKHGPSPRNRPARTRQAGHRNTGYL